MNLITSKWWSITMKNNKVISSILALFALALISPAFAQAKPVITDVTNNNDPVVTGKADLSYRVTGATSKRVVTSVTIYDQDGHFIRHLVSDKSIPVGETVSFDWSGKNDKGLQVEPGPYEFRIEARDGNVRAQRAHEGVLMASGLNQTETISGKRSALTIYHSGSLELETISDLDKRVALASKKDERVFDVLYKINNMDNKAVARLDVEPGSTNEEELVMRHYNDGTWNQKPLLFDSAHNDDDNPSLLTTITDDGVLTAAERLDVTVVGASAEVRPRVLNGAARGYFKVTLKNVEDYSLDAVRPMSITAGGAPAVEAEKEQGKLILTFNRSDLSGISDDVSVLRIIGRLDDGSYFETEKSVIGGNGTN